MQVNALDYLAQHLVALLDPSDIVANLYDAYRDPLQDGTLRRAGYGAVRDPRHRGCVENDGGMGQCHTPLVLFETYNICCEVCRFGSR